MARKGRKGMEGAAAAKGRSAWNNSSALPGPEEKRGAQEVRDDRQRGRAYMEEHEPYGGCGGRW